MNDRAFNRIYQDTARVCRTLSAKSAGARSDVAIPIITNSMPGVSSLYGPADILGACIGLTKSKNKLSLEDIDKMDKAPAYSAIPGVSGYRFAYRRRLLRDLLKDNPNKSTVSVPISEYLGPITSILSSGAVGALAGAAIGKGTGYPYTDESAVYGGLTGLGVGGASVLAAALASLFSKRRSLQDQSKYENSKGTLFKNYLLPGCATYNYFKSIGATTRMSNRRPGSLDAEYIEERRKKNKERRSSD